MMEEILIRDGGVLAFDASFLDVNEADQLLTCLLESVPWKQEGPKGRMFPRLTAWYANSGVSYSYSGVTHQPSPWLPVLLDLKTRIETAARAQFNSLLLNLYRDGRDSIGMHADDEPELGVNPVIGSLSLGAVRRFVLKHKTTSERMTFDLPHGSLIIMAGTSQHHWLHGLPKTMRPVGKRVNLTFRQIHSMLASR
jgi:alkylated DNA repair dioxygenase AlkB